MASPVFALSDAYIDRLAELDPGFATSLGIPGSDHLMTDFSPAGHEAQESLSRQTLAKLNTLNQSSDTDRLAAGVLRNSLEMSEREFAAGEHLRSIRVLAGNVDYARSVFDLMPTDTAEQWQTIAARMSEVSRAFAGMRESWQLGMQRKVVAPQRQVLAVANMLEGWAGSPATPGFFTALAAQADAVTGAPTDALRSAAREASAAMAATAAFLRNDYAPVADPRDGVGEERHALARQRYMGMHVDADDAYEWGFAEVGRLDVELKKCAALIKPGASLDEVRGYLDKSPEHSIQGEEHLRAWLQDLMDKAMDYLISNDHFDIPQSIRTIDAKISPPGGAAAQYYMPPSEDLTRPGSTWYPANGRTSFPLWSEPTTAYHEGVPGHHLQIGMAVVNREKLSRFQRNEFVSGHGEGWALYAERLMDEFGFLDRPEYRLGYLYAQAFRAARVVVDIGMHCEKKIPKHWSWHAGEAWNPQLAFEFMSARSSSDEAFNRSEIDRYLGWPAQAISYKLGERVWLQLRDEAKTRHGANFDLRAWHTYALGLGNLGLDLFKQEMALF
ncbi:MAG: DUF885 domain-containing protein [Ilumatobacteraceae bacterium]|nr:DUF885 domain-containing protein [Ilumatobacteraceae bacterium]